jgi:biopolymer transport protein ExbD
MGGGGSSEDTPVSINVTALVDIIFCLCLFFMCSLKFKELEGKLDSWLPKDKGAASAAQMNQTVDEIRILLSYDLQTKSLQRLFGQNRVVEQGPKGDLELGNLISQQFDNFKKLGKEVPVIIDAGPAVPWQFVIDIMNICRQKSIPKVEFGMGSQVR